MVLFTYRLYGLVIRGPTYPLILGDYISFCTALMPKDRLRLAALTKTGWVAGFCHATEAVTKLMLFISNGVARWLGVHYPTWDLQKNPSPTVRCFWLR